MGRSAILSRNRLGVREDEGVGVAAVHARRHFFLPTTDIKKMKQLMRRSLRTFFAATIGITATTCGEDPVDPTSEGLSSAEAHVLLDALKGLLVFDPASLQGILLIQNTPCPLGGATAAAGTVEFSEDYTTQTWSVTLVPADCVVGDGTMIFTLNGNPNIVYEGTFTIDVQNQQMLIDATVIGAATWALDDRMGDCTVSLTLEANLAIDASTGLTVTSGTLCGHQVSVTETLAT